MKGWSTWEKIVQFQEQMKNYRLKLSWPMAYQDTTVSLHGQLLVTMDYTSLRM